MAKIAVVDDDPSVRVLIEAGLVDDEHLVLLAETAEAGLDLVAAEAPDVLLLDINLPDQSGLEICKSVQAIDRRLPIVFITGDESGSAVIEAMKLGAYDFITKPIDIRRLREVLSQAIQSRHRMSVDVAIPARNGSPKQQDAIMGRSPTMINVFRAIAQCAGQEVPVLIRGESGTGKELVARAIYQHGNRADAPFLAVNCAALHENLLESELFGHEKGAFSGATSQRIGKFEQCDGGTIFLDEIGDLAPSVQSKVLRLLQQQEFQRLGGNETIKADVRVISATHRPLEEMCEKGDFRLDLFHRLNGFEIKLPALRERGPDILTLVEHFVGRAERDLKLENFEGIAPKAVELLLSYPWPGNVRELENAINRSLMIMTGPVLVEDNLPPEIRNRQAAASPTNDLDAAGLDELIRSAIAEPGNAYADLIETVEKRLLQILLAETDGNQSRAAEILGITRGKLRNRIRQFELDVDTLAEESDHDAG